MVGRFGSCKRQGLIAQCMVNLWNSLPQDVVIGTGTDGLGKFIEESSRVGHRHAVHDVQLSAGHCEDAGLGRSFDLLHS